ncbi:MAG: hypothetical protein GY789_09710 [Hyphomicrobiales bacterium]|nr:hypothetical protein [Hyphomicrobiales bacterium]MCP5001861.1 hypothetical protein [Hyphomicrobiales bacterium]
MQLPEWTKPALLGAGAGAIALAIIGFSWGGWMTGSSAAKMSSKDSMAAMVTALTPYCVQKSQADPNSTDLLAKLKEASSYQRRGIIEEAGWATPLDAEKPVRALADACQIALTKDL